MSIRLRPYQEEAIAAVRDGARRGVRRPLVGMPTGTGKTVVFSAIAQRAIAKGSRVLILAHRDELISQAADKLTQVAPELAMRIGIVKAQRDDHDADVVIASVQTIARQARLDRLARREFDIIIVDEAHHAAADSYQRILRNLGSFDPSGPLTLGVTATPQRADSLDLGETWEEIVYHRDMLSMMREGYLCDLRGVQIRMEGLDLAGVKTTAGDYNVGQLEAALEAADVPEHGVRAWKQYASGRKTIVFTPTVRLAEEVAEEFRKGGVRAQALSGHTPTDERREMLRKFHTGEVQIIANAQVLTEGFDEPTVECIMIARPTKSQPMYVQMVGRGTRCSPGKKDCVVLDMVGVTDRLDLTTLPRLFGLGEDEPSDGEAKPRSVMGEIAEQEERDRRSGKITARQVELFSRTELNWVRAADGHWTLGLPEGASIVMRAAGDRWNVVYSKRDQPPVLLGSDLEQGYAMGVGDDHARTIIGEDPRARALVSKNARWRQRPPSDKQLDALRRLRVNIPAGASAGECSDLMSAAIAQRGRR